LFLLPHFSTSQLLHFTTLKRQKAELAVGEALKTLKQKNAETLKERAKKQATIEQSRHSNCSSKGKKVKQ
jgi:hypothetical protein